MRNARENAARQRPNAAKNDNAALIRSDAGDNASMEDCEWIGPPIKDDMESLVGSDDNEPPIKDDLQKNKCLMSKLTWENQCWRRE